MKRLRLIAALVFLTAPAQAGSFRESDKGTTAAAFLKLGAGARAAGMGEAQITVVDDANAMYWNPAALTRVEGHTATFMRAEHLAGTSYNYGAYARRLSRGSSLGFSWQHFSAGELPETNESGAEVGSYSPGESAFAVGWAAPVTRIDWMEGGSAGVSLKYIRSTVIDTASAWALDAGVTLPPILEDRWRWAFTATNIGTAMRFDDAREPLPMALRIGQSLMITETFTIVTDFVLPRDNSFYPAAGVEKRMPLFGKNAWIARAGFNGRSAQDQQGIAGITMGLGLEIDSLRVDYAFLPMGRLGSTHRFSIGMAWGLIQKPTVIESTQNPDNEQVNYDDVFDLLH